MKSGTKSNLKVQIQGFKYKSFHKVFPLQQNAFDFMDENDEGEQQHVEETDQNDGRNKTDITFKSSCCNAERDGYDKSLLFSLERRLFAFEYNNQGKRRYVVSHLGRFMQEYWMGMKAPHRHFYELIRESTHCRLYFGALGSISEDIDVGNSTLFMYFHFSSLPYLTIVFGILNFAHRLGVQQRGKPTYH